MSLLVSLLKESNYNDAKNLLMRHPEVVHDTDSETGNHCIFYSLGSPELTNLILEMKPDAIKLKTSIGNNPLHVAAQTNAPIETLKVLISHKKSCASVKNSDGKVPLHYAAALGEYATIEVIDILIDAYPSGPAIKEMKNNSCPLHYACAFRASENVINNLITSYPTISLERDKSGNFPIHLAIIYGASSSVLLKLVEVSPECAKEVDGKQRLPLHLAIQYCSPVDLISALIRSYPRSLGIPDLNGRIPIHLAFKYKISLQAIEILLREDTSITCMGEDSENLEKFKERNTSMSTNYAIIHSAIEYGCGGDVINLILRVAPLAASQLSEDGKLPIHFAAWHQSPLGVIKALVRAYPDGLKIKEKRYENLPLHYAAQYQCEVRAASFILSAYSDASLIRNKKGRLPIHLAARYKADDLFVNALLKYHPFSIGIPDNTGRLPIDYALEYDAKASVVSQLMGIFKTRKPDKYLNEQNGNNNNNNKKDSTNDGTELERPEADELNVNVIVKIKNDSDDYVIYRHTPEFNEEEYEKVQGIILAAKKVNNDADEVKILPFGIAAVDQDGNIIFGNPPFEQNDCFGEKVPVAAFCLNSGIRGHISNQLLQLKQQNNEIRSLKEVIARQLKELEDKNLTIQQISRDSAWKDEKILRLENQIKEGGKSKSIIEFTNNKFEMDDGAREKLHM
jgi:ankyrin repeat protein